MELYTILSVSTIPHLSSYRLNDERIKNGEELMIRVEISISIQLWKQALLL
jgi:hypothetical protein